jgi:hypothetical protein
MHPAPCRTLGYSQGLAYFSVRHSGSYPERKYVKQVSGQAGCAAHEHRGEQFAGWIDRAVGMGRKDIEILGLQKNQFRFLADVIV